MSFMAQPTAGFRNSRTHVLLGVEIDAQQSHASFVVLFTDCGVSPVVSWEMPGGENLELAVGGGEVLG